LFLIWPSQACLSEDRLKTKTNERSELGVI
jgi:hypothetical protein